MRPLYLLRHGPTEAGAQGAPLGRRDLPVAPAGQERWPRVKAHLLGLGLGRVLTSDLARARDHARDLGLPVLILPDLAEQDFGRWDGLPWAQNPDAEAFFQKPAELAPPGGESFVHCARRALGAFREGMAGEEPVLVLAHGGPLRAILAHLLGIPAARALDLDWRPFGLSRVDLVDLDRGVLRFHNREMD